MLLHREHCCHPQLRSSPSTTSTRLELAIRGHIAGAVVLLAHTSREIHHQPSGHEAPRTMVRCFLDLDIGDADRYKVESEAFGRAQDFVNAVGAQVSGAATEAHEDCLAGMLVSLIVTAKERQVTGAAAQHAVLRSRRLCARRCYRSMA